MRDLKDVLWGSMTAPQIEDALGEGAVAAVPVGATEQHGAHLRADTDTSNVTAVAVAAARRARHRVLVAPALPFGLSPYHRSFASTISLSLVAYLGVLRDICENLAASGFSRIVIVNGHGGNSAPLRALASELVSQGRPVAAVDYWRPAEHHWRDVLVGPLKALGHGCELETALQLAIAADETERQAILAAAAALPARMDPPWVAGDGEDPILPFGASWAPVFDREDCGYTGDPASATLENGRRILDMMTGELARFFDAFATAQLKVGHPLRHA